MVQGHLVQGLREGDADAVVFSADHTIRMAVHTGVRGGAGGGGGRGQSPAECGGRRLQAALSLLRFSSPTPLWRKVLSTAVVGAPLLLGARYVMAEAREKRRMRLVVDGMGRFGR